MIEPCLSTSKVIQLEARSGREIRIGDRLLAVGEVRSAVLYEKSHSLVKCEYVWKRTDQWINFPWSTEPPVVDLEGAGTSVLDA